MARQRAGQAHAAFARVGTAPVGPVADDEASDSASGNADLPAIPIAGGNDGGIASPAAGPEAVRVAGRKAGRRVGRPQGPVRVALTTRILAANDVRLTAAVEATGQSPQYVVDAALTAYFDSLGIPG